jgi:prevent-host-death family protein
MKVSKVYHELKQGIMAMQQISVVQFRRNAETIIRRVQRGQRLILTYRGKPVMTLEPIPNQKKYITGTEGSKCLPILLFC